MNKWNVLKSRINKPGVHGKAHEISSTNPVVLEAVEMSSFCIRALTFNWGSHGVQKEAAYVQEDWDSKEAICIWVIQTHSKKGLWKKDTKERPKEKIQPEMPDSVNLENWDWIQLPD